MHFKDGLNVIIGSNNAGKTNLLKAIEMISKLEISVDDFNKNDLLDNLNEKYKKEAPQIEIEYQIYHEIDEENTEDEAILKLIPFLGLDKIEEHKNFHNSLSKYKIIANMTMRYAIEQKYINKYLDNIKEVYDIEKYLEALKKITQKYYAWNFFNSSNNDSVDKKAVSDIFKIDFIEAERNIGAVYKETREEIKNFINDDKNSETVKVMHNNITESIEQSLKNVLLSISKIIEEENNDIGLAKGNLAITQNVKSTASISDSYVIDVKDTKTNYDVPLSHNGVGYNNLISIYLLIKLVEMRETKDYRILCLEEPEAHLHPAMQYKLFSYIKRINDENKLNQQIFVSTHSSNITAVAGLDNMYILDYSRIEHKVISQDMKEQFKEQRIAKNHMIKFLDVTRSDMLFANKVILVEGIAEKLLLPKFMEKVGYPYEDEHISIVEIGGKHFDHFLKIFADNPINTKVLCITDKDYGDDEMSDLSSLLSFKPEHVKKLETNYSKNENIKIVYQKSYGRTFEDELFLTNYDRMNCIRGCKLLKIALSDALHGFINENCLSFDSWKSNKDSIDGRSKEKVEKIINLFNDYRSKNSAKHNDYEELFFAYLFLDYAKPKKGDVALQILIDDALLQSLIVPDYIQKGVAWLLT